MKVINCVFSTDDIRQGGAFLRGRPTIFRWKFLTLSRGIIRTSAARTAGRRFISMYSRTRRSETPSTLAASLVETYPGRSGISSVMDVVYLTALILEKIRDRMIYIILTRNYLKMIPNVV